MNEILDKSVDVLRRQMKNIVLYNLVYYFASMAVLTIIVIIGVFVSIFATITTKNNLVLIIVFSLIGLIFCTLRFAGNVGSIKLASTEFTNEKIGLGEALLATIKNLHKVLGIFLILLVLFIPAILLFWGALFLLFGGAGWIFLVEETLATAGVIFFILLGILILLFILVFFIYSTIFSLSLQSAVLEKVGVFKAVKRSFILITGLFWRNTGTSIIIRLSIYGIQYSLSSFVMLISGVLYFLLTLLKAPVTSLALLNLVSSLAGFPIQIIGALFILPLGTIMNTLFYYNIRFKREGYDLSLKLGYIKENLKGSN
jgi:hypothetical protein